MYADIIIDISHEQLDKTFQYIIPAQLDTCLQAGMQVTVPFGRGNRILTGYVIDITDKPAFDLDKMKTIIGLVSGKVRVEGRLIQLAAWIRHNYGGTMNQALKTVIPIKESVRHKEKKAIRLLVKKEEARQICNGLSKKRNAARIRLLEALIQDEIIEYSLVTNKLNISAQTIKSLADSKIIEVSVQEYYRNPVKVDSTSEKRNVLNSSQKLVIDSIISDYERKLRDTYLIHGVTGSGKTEIYMHLIEHVIQDGKQVIMLIPEISLTYQTVIRFYQRFGDRISIMNSRLSKGERYDQFRRALNGDIDIIIGPRSALFTPFSNIGLIVIDEEHEGSYKSETVPRYHARETAIQIAKMNHAFVVLGSATPSIDSYYKALTREYTLFSIDQRVNAKKLPKVYVADLRKELKEGNRSIFSVKLQKLMQERLDKKQQTILFLNKRGYAGFLSCRSCGYVLKCPHCDISLTSHNNGKLVCHYCGYEEPMVKACPSCGSKYISGFRAGTQQVQEIVSRMFPKARVLRMDADTTSAKGGHEKILGAFSNQEADILIGTQMIVKGHDFPNVTLVGILAADLSLYSQDFRASERTFQLLTQAAGRAGRGDEAGEVVIQTYSPEHFSVATASDQNYREFYEHEIMYRTLLNYPPVCNLLMIRLASKDEQTLIRGAELFNKALIGFSDIFQVQQEKQPEIIGPVDASLYKANDIYNKVVYIKSQSYQILTEYKDRMDFWIRESVDFRKINVQYDFNPVNI